MLKAMCPRQRGDQAASSFGKAVPAKLGMDVVPEVARTLFNIKIVFGAEADGPGRLTVHPHFEMVRRYVLTIGIAVGGCGKNKLKFPIAQFGIAPFTDREELERSWLRLHKLRVSG
jgi:hypothetical protein